MYIVIIASFSLSECSRYIGKILTEFDQIKWKERDTLVHEKSDNILGLVRILIQNPISRSFLTYFQNFEIGHFPYFLALA